MVTVYSAVRAVEKSEGGPSVININHYSCGEKGLYFWLVYAQRHPAVHGSLLTSRWSHQLQSSRKCTSLPLDTLQLGFRICVHYFTLPKIRAVGEER